jgi:hypothetical protein
MMPTASPSLQGVLVRKIDAIASGADAGAGLAAQDAVYLKL